MFELLPPSTNPVPVNGIVPAPLIYDHVIFDRVYEESVNVLTLESPLIVNDPREEPFAVKDVALKLELKV